MKYYIQKSKDKTFIHKNYNDTYSFIKDNSNIYFATEEQAHNWLQYNYYRFCKLVEKNEKLVIVEQ